MSHAFLNGNLDGVCADGNEKMLRGDFVLEIAVHQVLWADHPGWIGDGAAAAHNKGVNAND